MLKPSVRSGFLPGTDTPVLTSSAIIPLVVAHQSVPMNQLPLVQSAAQRRYHRILARPTTWNP